MIAWMRENYIDVWLIDNWLTRAACLFNLNVCETCGLGRSKAQYHRFSTFEYVCWLFFLCLVVSGLIFYFMSGFSLSTRGRHFKSQPNGFSLAVIYGPGAAHKSASAPISFISFVENILLHPPQKRFHLISNQAQCKNTALRANAFISNTFYHTSILYTTCVPGKQTMQTWCFLMFLKRKVVMALLLYN